MTCKTNQMVMGVSTLADTNTNTFAVGQYLDCATNAFTSATSPVKNYDAVGGNNGVVVYESTVDFKDTIYTTYASLFSGYETTHCEGITKCEPLQ